MSRFRGRIRKPFDRNYGDVNNVEASNTLPCVNKIATELPQSSDQTAVDASAPRDLDRFSEITLEDGSTVPEESQMKQTRTKRLFSKLRKAPEKIKSFRDKTRLFVKSVAGNLKHAFSKHERPPTDGVRPQDCEDQEFSSDSAVRGERALISMQCPLTNNIRDHLQCQQVSKQKVDAVSETVDITCNSSNEADTKLVAIVFSPSDINPLMLRGLSNRLGTVKAEVYGRDTILDFITSGPPEDPDVLFPYDLSHLSSYEDDLAPRRSPRGACAVACIAEDLEWTSTLFHSSTNLKLCPQLLPQAMGIPEEHSISSFFLRSRMVPSLFDKDFSDHFLDVQGLPNDEYYRAIAARLVRDEYGEWTSIDT